MDLDIAIKYYSNLADDFRRKASHERNDYMDLKDLATEHAQLSDWLNELKVLREKVRILLEKDRWIPVSERLPEEYGEYRITWKTSRSDKTLIADSEFDPLLKLDNEHGRFKGWILDDYIKFYPGVEVIAWKPIEDPYTPPEK